MVRDMKRIFLCIVLAFVLGIGTAFAGTPIQKETTTVTNSLPEVTVYMPTDVEGTYNTENIEVFVDDMKTELQSVNTMKDMEKGISYFVLMDVSTSIADEDLARIKESIRSFVADLSQKDTIYFVPFGEEVYGDKVGYAPDSDELLQQIDQVEAKDRGTRLYTAMDAVTDMAKETGAIYDRTVAMVFTDGADVTSGGMITEDESVVKLSDAGIPIYAFAVGNKKTEKDSLGVLARSTGGSLTTLKNGSEAVIMEDFVKLMAKTVVVKTKVKNSEDIGQYFSVRVLKEGKELSSKSQVKTHKTEASKDVLSVKVKKIFLTYWWLFALLGIAIIAAVVLLVIRKNKGIVTVDGKVVYGNKVQTKYKVQVKEYHKKPVTLQIRVNGSGTHTQHTDIVESMIVGRAKTCDMCVADSTMSRQHFCIELAKDELYILDLESTDGTYLNGVKVSGRVRVHSGDIINAGRTEIRIGYEV